MKPAEYLSKRAALIHAYENLEFENNQVLNSQFNMVSASLINYAPAIDFSEHATIYRKILLHKKLSILEQAYTQVLDIVETENLSEELLQVLKTKATIICTFHTGSYRVINLLLAKYGIPYSLVIGKEITEKEGDLFSSLYERLPYVKTKSNFRIINAEKETAGLQMLKELKQGRSLVLYIDGNTGSGRTTALNENCCTIKFLHQHLHARKGIAYLGYVADVPIVTVGCYRPLWEKIKLRFFEPIYPDKNLKREDAAIAATQVIYDHVTPIIKAYPEQWEGWLYIHKIANLLQKHKQPEFYESNLAATEDVQFNSRLFGIFKLKDNSFLLKKDSYLFYEIDNRLYDLLMRCRQYGVKKNCFDKAIFQQLYDEGVLMCV